MTPASAALYARLAASASTAAGWLGKQAGWRHALASTGFGMLSVLAMAPFFLWPVLFATLPGLVWLIDASLKTANDGVFRQHGRRTIRTHAAMRAAATGWLFGFGYHLAGLFWIGEAFLVEAEKFAVLMPFAVTLMPAGLALFWAAAAAAASFAWRPGLQRPGLQRVVALAIALSAAEWLRGHVLSGFPWNVLGYALTWPLPLMQSASVFGIYGLTLLTVIIFAAPGVLLSEALEQSGAAPARRRWIPIVAPLGMIGLLFGSGLIRLAGIDPVLSPSRRVRIVQPSVPQREKWLPQNQERIFRQHLELSLRNALGKVDGAQGVSLILWPEAAMPFLPLRSPAALEAIGRMLPKGAYLASGALRLVDAVEAEPGGHRDIFNSLMMFGETGELVANYDKIHLVPFGEYLPLQSTLEFIGLEQLSRLRGGFASGVRPRPLLTVPGLPELGPLICYEAIFPATLVQGRERPAAFINVTNDGWFGNTTGPRQHFHQTRVRAVEEGLPILRAANNGISAIIDAKGRVLARADLNEVATIDGEIPAALAPPPYARFGDAIFVFLMGAALLLLAYLDQIHRRVAGLPQS